MASRGGVKKKKSAAPSKSKQADEILKCGKDPKYFINNYIKIHYEKKGVIPFDTFDFQDDCLTKFLSNRYVIINKSRQLGLTTLCAAYALWMALFQREKNILVIATKLDTANIFVKKVQSQLQTVPDWLKMPDVTAQSTKKISFSNGSEIKATPRSKDVSRGEALSLVIVDECTSYNSYITLRNKNTGEIKRVKIGEFYNSL